MLLIRDIMHCKPGKVRPMVEKFLAASKILERQGAGAIRVMTDVAAERYWTVVAEFEVPDFETFEAMGPNSENAEEFQAIMKGYHDLIDDGRREIYTIEG